MFVSTQNGWAALHLAAQEGKVDVVRLLLTEAQTLVNIQNKVHKQCLQFTSIATFIVLQLGRRPIDIARSKQHFEIVDLLQKKAYRTFTTQ